MTFMLGGCRCGHVRFRLDAAPIITHACHCRLCQTFTGTPFNSVCMIETKHVVVVEGATEVVAGENSHDRVECVRCHSVLWIHRKDLQTAIALVGVGMLDEGASLPPEAHYFVRSKHPWIVLPEGVPAFETIGNPGKAGAGERIVAALAEAGIEVRMPGG